MISGLVKKVFGTRNDRILRELSKKVSKINALEAAFEQLSDNQLKLKTDEFRQRHQEGETLDALMVEAFALVREASKRTLGLRHFDVQLLGGMVLHDGRIAEMRTGEGKTLTSTLAVYLNALAGKGVHIITVNDYLAERDANWMRPIYEFLGLTVGINLSQMSHEDKKKAYAADITVGTNNEFGFDYLRDNMAFDVDMCVQRGLNYAIVDEVDSILIDEARTPLIISGQMEESSDLYAKIDVLIPKLERQMVEESFEITEDPIDPALRGDFIVDEKNKQVHLTDLGHEHLEALLTQAQLCKANTSLYDPANIHLMHYAMASLRAHTLYFKDVDYIVKNGQVLIVDEHTGRLMEGRRWSEGLHQAVEAKEKVSIELENQTMASITFQNYFRLYEKLSGMTGTADTEAYELNNIYGLEVVIVPTHRLMVRDDMPDQVFLTTAGKYRAILKDITDSVKRGQPVLVGTASIETSEHVSQFLKKAKIKHQVLNAKQHEKEASIIAQAGMPGAVTIATNMAGRGTDIVLGGHVEWGDLDPDSKAYEKEKARWSKLHDEVLASGGLRVIGTERHESRRIDNQLRGRSGRQGDPGSSQFYLSLEDNLMRIFVADHMSGLMRKMGIGEDEVIEHSLVTKAIANAQKKVEGINFDVRKSLLDFDNVANDQRKVIYKERFEILNASDVSPKIKTAVGSSISRLVDALMPPQSMEEQWDLADLDIQLKQMFNMELNLAGRVAADTRLNQQSVKDLIIETYFHSYNEKIEKVGLDAFRQAERNIFLQFLDFHWKEHLAAMEQLRRGIHLRGYAQKNPKQEFNRESYDMFQGMWHEIKHDVSAAVAHLDGDAEIAEPPREQVQLEFRHDGVSSEDSLFAEATGTLQDEKPAQPYTRQSPKVGRNAPCPCGSGKKYKQCHGKID